MLKTGALAVKWANLQGKRRNGSCKVRGHNYEPHRGDMPRFNNATPFSVSSRKNTRCGNQTILNHCPTD